MSDSGKSIIVVDIADREVAVSDVSELDSNLSQRNDANRNCFWISHGTEKYPQLDILMNDNRAALYYFEKEGYAGFSSIVDEIGQSNGSVPFSISSRPADDVFLSNGVVVFLSQALGVAREFFHSSALPKSINWLEL